MNRWSIRLFFLLTFLSFTALLIHQGGLAADTSLPTELDSAELQASTAFIPLVTGAQPNMSSFEDISYDLVLMEQFYSGGNGEPVIFDSAAASNAGFSITSITLADQLAAFTNELLANAAEDGILAETRTNTYPLVEWYFQEASTNLDSFDQRSGDTTTGWCSRYLTDAACTCGHWNYPRPSRAANWQTFTVSNPRQTLQSWGYHETPNLAGGGWTRARTYYASRCGWSTFRDHAYIYTSTSLREQNYGAQGIVPNGEPNPEVYRSGPWPYAAWPSYVYWWHQSGPGR